MQLDSVAWQRVPPMGAAGWARDIFNRSGKSTIGIIPDAPGGVKKRVSPVAYRFEQYWSQRGTHLGAVPRTDYGQGDDLQDTKLDAPLKRGRSPGILKQERPLRPLQVFPERPGPSSDELSIMAMTNLFVSVSASVRRLRVRVLSEAEEGAQLSSQRYTRPRQSSPHCTMSEDGQR